MSSWSQQRWTRVNVFPLSSRRPVGGSELTPTVQLSVSAERVGEAAQQNEDQRKEVMVFTFNLLCLMSWIAIVSLPSASKETKFNDFLFQNISANLLNEIKAFGETASEQRARLEVRRLLDLAATLCSCRVQ